MNATNKYSIDKYHNIHRDDGILFYNTFIKNLCIIC